MKNKGFLAILALIFSVLLSSGCAARSGSGWRMSPRWSLTPPVLTVVATNNTIYPLYFFEDGEPVMVQDPQTKEWKKVFVPSGGTVSRGYYSFMGSRQVVLTAQAICPAGGIPPKSGQPNTGCGAGRQVVGTVSRTFHLYSGSNYRSESWVINYIQPLRGSY